MKVRVAIEPLDEIQLRLYRPEVIAKIHAAQAARGHRPPSREEVYRHMRPERDRWGD